jgi:hypothetical protein
MNGLPKSKTKQIERNHQPMVGSAVIRSPLPARPDLSDWVDLMEVIEALCPKWPAQPTGRYMVFKL